MWPEETNKSTGYDVFYRVSVVIFGMSNHPEMLLHELGLFLMYLECLSFTCDFSPVYLLVFHEKSAF